MPERNDPFEQYLVNVQKHLRPLHPEQRNQILQELREHLEDAASAYGEQADRPVVRTVIIGNMGSPRKVGRALTKAHSEPRLWQRVLWFAALARALLVTFFVGVCLLLLLGSTMIVPAPSPNTATLVTGKVRWISMPSPTYGDMTIMLQDGRNFYVNRANEVDYFNWQGLLREVHPGDTLHLTAVEPLSNRLFRGAEPGHGAAFTPLAGVRTDTTVYMDDAISARTWDSVAHTVRLALWSLLLAVLCFSPEFLRAARRRMLQQAR